MSDSNHDKDLDALYEYRTIKPTDLQEIKALHEEFFPVRYVDQFYQEAVEGKGIGGDNLYTIIVTAKGTNCNYHGSSSSGGGGRVFSMSSASGTSIEEGNLVSSDDNNTLSAKESGEMIIGFLFGQFMNTDICEERDIFDIAKRPRKMFYILTIGVRKEYRNVGLASHLVQKSIQAAKEDQSCGIVYLHVIHYNAAAIRMYEKNNFEFLKTMHNFYHIERDYYDSYLYGIFLNGYEGEYMMKLANIVRKNTSYFFANIMVVFNRLFEKVRKTFSMYENPSIMQAVAGEVSDVVDCHGDSHSPVDSVVQKKLGTTKEQQFQDEQPV